MYRGGQVLARPLDFASISRHVLHTLYCMMLSFVTWCVKPSYAISLVISSMTSMRPVNMPGVIGHWLRREIGVVQITWCEN